MPFTPESLSVPPSSCDLAALHALLRDAVESGASIGFTLPLTDPEISAYWAEVLSAVADGPRVLLVTRDDTHRIVGSVQLELAQRSNSRHRCELQKLLVLRSHRGRRLGFTLMQAAEHAARAAHRTLIVLDTSASGNALNLYDRCGYTHAGVIPRYATDPDGTFIDTVLYYKALA
jgi:ribosomal protein S18 acetylase RimI-like enzyme